MLHEFFFSVGSSTIHMAFTTRSTDTRIEASPVNPTMAGGDVATESGFSTRSPDLYEVLRTSI